MKEYILDYSPSPLVAEPAEGRPDAVPVRARRSWRRVVLLVGLVALTLAVFSAVLIGFAPKAGATVDNPGIDRSPLAAPSPSQDPAQTPVPAPVETRAPPAATQATPPQAEVVAEPAEVVASRITREHGRYVIDLHTAGVGAAVEMLARATGATVRGEDVLAGNRSLITRRVTTDSPLEAWQAVFGGVANFAATCSHGACAVRFVPSTDPAVAARSPRPAVGAAAIVPAEESPTVDN